MLYLILIPIVLLCLALVVTLASSSRASRTSRRRLVRDVLHRKDTPALDPHDTTAPDTLLSVSEAATTLGLRPATVEQYIQKGQLAAVRLPHGHATRLSVAHTEIDRYRHAP